MNKPEIGDYAKCIDGHSGIVTAVKAVSYTHLDVYKRQR